MKRTRRLIFPIILLLAVLAALWYYWVRPAGSLGSAWNSLLHPSSAAATALTASGTVEMTEVNVAPEAAGKIMAVNVKEGDTVHVGDVLAQLDDTLLKDQRAIAASNLATAKIALAQLTSPATIASVQAAIAQDKQNIDDAQQAYDNQRTYTTNQDAVQNSKASLVLATKALQDAQTDYDKIDGSPENNTDKAAAYQKLYAAQTAYNSANYNYNFWLGKVDNNQLEIKAGLLAVAKAKLPEDQALLDALNGGTIAENATGAGLVQLQQARIAVQLAQANLNLLDDEIKKMTVTSLVNGMVMTRNAEPGSVVNAGAVLLTIGRLDELTITVYVPEDRIGEVMLGQTANVSVDSFPGVIFKAVVTYISDQAEFTPRNVETVSGRKNTVFAVKLTLSDISGKLKPGMPADVVFNPK
ncbi:MAG TPA: efflux RND transporter periplasmic adaptor subunit [Anaerolineales bacterium]|nr:efflux RND transporter periplasmic adaptor subunit [Anaerolineales bacterium]